MTIERVKGLQTATCDGVRCQEYLESLTWAGLMEALKDERWRSVPRGENWFHYCESCTKELDEKACKNIEEGKL